MIMEWNDGTMYRLNLHRGVKNIIRHCDFTNNYFKDNFQFLGVIIRLQLLLKISLSAEFMYCTNCHLYICALWKLVLKKTLYQTNSTCWSQAEHVGSRTTSQVVTTPTVLLVE